MKSVLSAGAAAFVAVLGGLAMASPADAVSGNCTHWVNKAAISGAPDAYRVGAACTSLGGDSKARGVLMVNEATDSHTAWFTTINKSYYSSYRQMFSWDYQGTRLELTNR